MVFNGCILLSDPRFSSLINFPTHDRFLLKGCAECKQYVSHWFSLTLKFNQEWDVCLLLPLYHRIFSERLTGLVTLRGSGGLKMTDSAVIFWVNSTARSNGNIKVHSVSQSVSWSPLALCSSVPITLTVTVTCLSFSLIMVHCGWNARLQCMHCE